MSSSAAYPAVSRDPRLESRILLVLIWCVAVVTLLAMSGMNSVSTDDAMSLVEVRDFLAGQSWFDMTQYRLDPAGRRRDPLVAPDRPAARAD